MNIHSLIVLKGANVNVYCQDGMSALTKLNVERLLVFGGKLKPVNCGAANVYLTLREAAIDMHHRIDDGYNTAHNPWPNPNPNPDDVKALHYDEGKLDDFQHTDVFKIWT